MKSLKIIVLYGNREDIVYIHDLTELEKWINDFFNDYYGGISQLYIYSDDRKLYVPVNISCEKELVK